MEARWVRAREAPTHDLARFSLADMADCSAALRTLGTGAHSMDQAAGRIVRFLYEELADAESGKHCCALVRFFKTHHWSGLDEEMKRAASAALSPSIATPAMKCLTLLASAGDEPDWNDPRRSKHHLAIPLPSTDNVASIPMISRLVDQLGVKIGELVARDDSLLSDREQNSYNVFYVQHAAGSEYIPAQAEFVERFGIKSVLGFGGVLPTGDLFVVILFSKTEIEPGTSKLFEPLALSAKMAVLPFANGPIFADSP